MTQEESSDLDVGPDVSGPNPTLQIDGVGKIFPDGTEALTDISLSLNQGTFASIVGPSGCGKSTLLRIVAGLDQSTIGTCLVDRANLGYVFQEPTLLPWRTVRQNIELSFELGSKADSELNRKTLLVDEALELVRLEDFDHFYPRQLSGGMKMRVSIARALARRPPLLLFDEPFAALDEITREQLNEQTLRIYSDQGFTALFVTHSIAEAVFMSSQVHVMSARPGQIVDTVAVPFPYPRQPELRFDPAFTDLCAEISRSLREMA